MRAIGVTNAVAIAAGQSHTLAVLRDGTVVAWGRNDNGQLGDRSFVQRNAPVVSTFTDAFAVAAGNHTLVLSWDGSIWGAGLNQNGQLGNGSTTTTSLATQVPGFYLRVPGEVALPTFSPAGGLYGQPQTVTISCATYGAMIHYTTNGNTPTEADPVISSGSSVNIEATTYLRARAFMLGNSPSDVRSDLYLIGVQPGGDGPIITITYPTTGIRQL